MQFRSAQGLPRARARAAWGGRSARLGVDTHGASHISTLRRKLSCLLAEDFALQSGGNRTGGCGLSSSVLETRHSGLCPGGRVPRRTAGPVPPRGACVPAGVGGPVTLCVSPRSPAGNVGLSRRSWTQPWAPQPRVSRVFQVLLDPRSDRLAPPSGPTLLPDPFEGARCSGWLSCGDAGGGGDRESRGF